MVARVFFRTDGNSEISAGHVLRCLAIADALRDIGIESCFVTSDMEQESRIRDFGFTVIGLGSDWRDLDGEIGRMRELLAREPVAMVLVDTYSATERYIDALADCVVVGYLGIKKLEAPRLSLLVNYSTEIDRAFYGRAYGSSATRLLLGPAFTPLRKEFASVPPAIRESPSTLLITTGNTDSLNMSPQVLERALRSRVLKDARFRVVVGSMYEDPSPLQEMELYSERVELVHSPISMSELMCSCDAAVSACGSTLYELGACSVPTVGFAVSAEQVESGRGMAGIGAIIYAGEAYAAPGVCAAKTVSMLERIWADRALRSGLSEVIHSVSDGRGSSRIANVIADIAGNRWDFAAGSKEMTVHD